jgi:hypothetical protein
MLSYYSVTIKKNLKVTNVDFQLNNSKPSFLRDNGKTYCLRRIFNFITNKKGEIDCLFI